MIVLVMTLYTHWSLHTEPQSFLLISDNIEWQQPSIISNSYPKLISTRYWQFDYEATEKTLLAIKQKKNGELTLNASAAKVLEQAVSTLPPQMNENELKRVELLVAKGLPGKAGHELSTLLANYYHYQQASNIAHVSANTKQNKHDKERSFQQTVLRQERYLGKDITQQLFGRQNALTHYLYARQHINENLNLNQAQKQRQLNTLKDRFKAHARRTRDR